MDGGRTGDERMDRVSCLSQKPYRPIDGFCENPFLQFIPVVGTLLSYKRIKGIEKQFQEFQAAFQTELGATTIAEDRFVSLFDPEEALKPDPQESAHQIPLKDRLEYLTALQQNFKDAVEASSGGWAVRFVAWIVCAIVLSPFLWIGLVLDCLCIHCYLLEKKINIEEIDNKISETVKQLEEEIRQEESSSSDPFNFNTPFFQKHGPELIDSPHFGM